MRLRFGERQPDWEKVRTEMVVGDTQIKEGAGVTFDVYTALIQIFCAFYVAFLKFLGALFQAKEGFFFGGIRCCRVRCPGGCPAYEVKQLGLGLM